MNSAVRLLFLITVILEPVALTADPQVYPSEPPLLKEPIQKRGSIRSDLSLVLERARDSPAIRGKLFEFVSSADELLKKPLSVYQRPSNAEQIPRELIDSGAMAAGKNREKFALAMYDCHIADVIRRDGVTLAIAARFTGQPQYLVRALDLLRLIVDHRPFQRSGWTLAEPQTELPPGGDGVWLATGWGITGLCELLEILDAEVPAQLTKQAQERLREEANLVVASWNDKVPWFVRSKAVTSNQWIEPICGLIRACAYLKDSNLADSLKVGEESLAETVRSLGDDGAFPEGFTYAQMTLSNLFCAIESLDGMGRQALSEAPFTRNSWRWFVSMPLGENLLVNCSDSKLSTLPAWQMETASEAMLSAALASDDATAIETVLYQFPRIPPSLMGLRVLARWPGLIEPHRPRLKPSVTPWAVFPSQQLVVWRSTVPVPSKSFHGLSLFVKGGSSSPNGHGHRDQGHISISYNGKAVLIDCGTPEYSNPDYRKKFASAAGHSIMQFEPVQPSNQAIDASVQVRRIDDSGGLLRIDTTKAYTSAISCSRIVEWQSNGSVRIHDSVTFKAPVPKGTELYRFHTGVSQPLNLTDEDKQWRASSPVAEITIDANHKISVDQQTWPDRVTASNRHQAIRLVASEEIQSIEIVTSIEPVLQAEGVKSP